MLADRQHRFDSIHLRPSGRANSDLRLTSFRSRPYPSAPPKRPFYREPPPGNPDGQWSHDLFEADSDIYEPKIRFKADLTLPIRASDSESSVASTSQPGSKPQIAAPIPAAPLVNSRLFSSTGILNPPTSKSGASEPAIIAPQASATLLSRMQSGSNLGPALQPTALAPKPFPAMPVPRPQPTQAQLKHARELQDQKARHAAAQQAYEEALEKYMTGPVVLEISNLAEGTSVDDVITAFGDFGEILDCTTEEGVMHGFQPTLKAKMVFVHQSDAQKAAEALNGVLADGLVLSVSILSRYGKKPERADFAAPTPSQLALPPSAPSVAVPEGIIAVEDVDMQPAIESEVMALDPTPAPISSITGKLRSEALALCDSGASLQYEPQPTTLYKPALPLLTDRVQPVASPSPSAATDDLMRSIGISADAMKLMSRLQGVEPSLPGRKGSRGNGSGTGRNQNRSGGGGARTTGSGAGKSALSKGGKSSLLARMGHD